MEKITVGSSVIDVRREDIDKWRRRISKPAQSSPARPSGGYAISTERVKELAGEFGLLERTQINPGLVFIDQDIKYWRDRRLDEGRLGLEFAARKLILETSERQRVKIADREVLAKAAQQLIPVLERARQEELARIITSAICKGDTSEQFTQQAWEGLNRGNFALVMACTDSSIKKWSRQADTQQAKASASGCSETPQATDLKPFFASNWALSDIGTSWFIQGEAFSRQGKWAEAREAYKTVIDRYPCAFAWDPRGWFWRVADAAQEKYDEVRLK
ncbi:MAG TPA: tetratricopeptide repeat protein [Pyrinomonadaceae bacterium]